MADAVCGRKADRKNVRISIAPEVVAFHRFEREVERNLVDERRAPQLDVVLLERRQRREHMRERDVLPIPLSFDCVLAGVLLIQRDVVSHPRPALRGESVGVALAVPVVEPLRRGLHVVAAGDEVAARVLEPIRRIGAMPRHQNG